MRGYHDGQRRMQDARGTRAIADRLAEVTYRAALTADDQARIAAADMFFLATADDEGRPDCSYKGGDPGFVRVLSEREIAWGDYDGNGQLRSLGNVLVNPHVALLFIDWQKPNRLRVLGRAEVQSDDPLLASFVGAQSVVRVTIDQVFPNCPRYVHRMERTERSPYVPREGETPPVPGWKRDPRFAPVLPGAERVDDD